MLRKRCSLLFTLGLTVSSLLTAAESTQTPSDANAVYLHVTASDKQGRAIVGLAKEQFKVLEDNVQQEIAFFSEETGPLSVGVLLDAIGAAKDQARAMAADALASNRGPRDKRVFFTDAENQPLNDAVYQTLQRLVAMDNKRVLVLFTTRNDPGANSFSKVKELLKGQDIQVYVIHMLPTPAEMTSGADTLRELAELSGGAAFFPPLTSSVPYVFRSINAQMQNQYVLGYRPKNAATNGSWRKVKVTVDTREMKLPPLSIQTKAGYYASSR
jgi:Ca-activated chloride channel family protein